ncbi:MAG: hypothetical protein IPG45_37650 [Deltaproteobacteria bacterium]|jgi:hypothetical protein|nr:hypothetical protein [Deltaproteobacteria bacterium]
MQEPSTTGTKLSGIPAATTKSDGKTARILARSIFKDMKSYGIANEKILEVASELIGLVTEQLKEDTEVPNGRA